MRLSLNSVTGFPWKKPALEATSAHAEKKPINLVAFFDASENDLAQDAAQQINQLEAAKSLLKENLYAAAIVNIPNAYGNKTITYQISPDRSPLEIDSTILEQEKTQGTDPVVKFATLMADSMRPYSRNVVYISGHGFAATVAGMTTEQVGIALKYAQAYSRQKPDFIIMDSCIMGNLEGLSLLKDKGKIAIVSEEVVPLLGYIPLNKILAEMSNSRKTPEKISEDLVKIIFRNHYPNKTAAAIDLEKIDELNQSFQQVLNCLARESSSGGRLQEIVAALKKSQEPLSQENHYLLGLGDLGLFLKSIPRQRFSPETGIAIDAAQRSLKETVLAKRTSDHDLSGISFLAQRFFATMHAAMLQDKKG